MVRHNNIIMPSNRRGYLGLCVAADESGKGPNPKRKPITPKPKINKTLSVNSTMYDKFFLKNGDSSTNEELIEMEVST